jgi:hypothetical protein
VTTAFEDHPQSAVLQIASDTPQGGSDKTRIRIPCTFQGIEGKRLVLEASERVSPSTMVSVEYSDALFLGDVMSCTHINTDFWQIEIRVEQVLSGLQSLMALRAGLLGKAVPQRLGLVPAGVRN